MGNQTVNVPVKSAWSSKVNWTQAIGVGASLAALFGGHQMSPETQTEIIVGIQALQGVATWVIKTWFTGSVSGASVGR